MDKEITEGFEVPTEAEEPTEDEVSEAPVDADMTMADAEETAETSEEAELTQRAAFMQQAILEGVAAFR